VLLSLVLVEQPRPFVFELVVFLFSFFFPSEIESGVFSLLFGLLICVVVGGNQNDENSE
jgi:hypothetical protein